MSGYKEKAKVKNVTEHMRQLHRKQENETKNMMQYT